MKCGVFEGCFVPKDFSFNDKQNCLMDGCHRLPFCPAKESGISCDQWICANKNVSSLQRYVDALRKKKRDIDFDKQTASLNIQLKVSLLSEAEKFFENASLIVREIKGAYRYYEWKSQQTALRQSTNFLMVSSSVERRVYFKPLTNKFIVIIGGKEAKVPEKYLERLERDLPASIEKEYRKAVKAKDFEKHQPVNFEKLPQRSATKLFDSVFKFDSFVEEVERSLKEREQIKQNLAEVQGCLEKQLTEIDNQITHLRNSNVIPYRDRQQSLIELLLCKVKVVATIGKEDLSWFMKGNDLAWFYKHADLGFENQSLVKNPNK